MTGLDRIERRAGDVAVRTADRAKRGVESACRIGGSVYGQAERHLVPRRLIELRSLERDWRKRAALKVLSAFMVSLSLGLIALNVAVVVDAPKAQAAGYAQGAILHDDIVQSLHALPPTPPAQGYVAHAMGRHSATLPRPVDADAMMYSASASSLAELAPATPTAEELRREYAEYSARFEAMNSQPAAELAARAEQADEAARLLAAHTRPALDAAPLPEPSPEPAAMTTTSVSGPADVWTQAHDRADVATVGSLQPHSP